MTLIEMDLAQDPLVRQTTAEKDLPVGYYVRYGPAVLEGNTLCITDVPLRAARPIEVSVVACRWGRSREPLYQSAPPSSKGS
jgi:hypothetical protein